MKVNVTELIDGRGMSPRQWLIIVLCALVALLDGFDTQSIGVAAPHLAAALHLGRPALAPVFSAGLLGAMAGAMLLGRLGDLLGRRRVLIAATIVFAIFTTATAFATSYESLLAWRFLAGIGLGGATPCFIALTAEYAPARLRGATLSAMWAGFPLGGVLGGLVNPHLISAFGWRSLFYVGGALPIVLAIVLALVLPESLRFLIAKSADIGRIRTVLARIAPEEARLGTEFFVTEQHARGSSVANLFTDGRSIPTLLLWAMFFGTFLLLVFTPLWVPTLLQGPGRLGATQAALIVALNNLGAAIGTATFGRLLDRGGSRRVLVGVYCLAGLFMAGIGQGGMSVALPALCSLVAGYLLGCANAGAITLSAGFYPTEVRSTGVGWAMAAGRLGQVAGPILAGAMLAAGWEANRIFPAIALFTLLCALCVFLLSARVSASRGTLAPAEAVSPH